METPYRAVSYKKHDVIARPTLDQLQQNYQWINDNTPRGRFYRGETGARSKNLVVLAGKKEIRQDTKTGKATVDIGFGKAFAPACNPSVTTGINADFQRRIFCAVHGPRGVNYPNHNGCQVTIVVAAETDENSVIKKNLFVHWSAMGFREDSINEF